MTPLRPTAARAKPFTVSTTEAPRSPKVKPPAPPVDGMDADADPMTHITILAADDMRGRNAPSADFDRACAYVEDVVARAGLKAVRQPFNMFTFEPDVVPQPRLNDALFRTPPNHSDALDNEFDPADALFTQSFYLDGNLAPEALDIINRRYRAVAKKKGFQTLEGSGPEGNLTVEEIRKLATAQGQTQNVIVRIAGNGKYPNEAIVLMSHLDHVGVNGRGEVYNGADDNASGSSTNLSLLQRFVEVSKQGKLDRDIYVVWTAAEEDGLVGGEYFAANPPDGVDFKKVAYLNCDMDARWGDDRISILHGLPKGRLDDLHAVEQSANQAMGTPFSRINHDIDGLAGRQDGSRLHARGAKGLVPFEGLSNPNGGGNLHPDYHRPTDDTALIVRDNGGNKPRRVADFIFNAAMTWANAATL